MIFNKEFYRNEFNFSVGAPGTPDGCFSIRGCVATSILELHLQEVQMDDFQFDFWGWSCGSSHQVIFNKELYRKSRNYGTGAPNE